MKVSARHILIVLALVLGGLSVANAILLRDVSALLIQKPVDAILISDSACAECFDPQGYVQVLQRLGMTVGEVSAYDILSPRGAKFVKEYGITKVPALLLSPPASDLSGFEESWREVGTKEEDGWFVLREVQKVNPGFKEL